MTNKNNNQISASMTYHAPSNTNPFSTRVCCRQDFFSPLQSLLKNLLTRRDVRFGLLERLVDHQTELESVGRSPSVFVSVLLEKTTMPKPTPIKKAKKINDAVILGVFYFSFFRTKVTSPM